MKRWGQIGILLGWGVVLSLASAAEPPARAETAPRESTREAASNATTARSRAQPTPTTPAPNPLEPFLGVWMTRRDHALLRQGPFATSERPPAALPEMRRPVAATSRPTTSTPNPYLETMAETPAPPAAPVLAPPAKPSAEPSAQGEAGVVLPTLTAPENPPPAPPSRYRPPPSTDAKYFPQQKRF